MNITKKEIATAISVMLEALLTNLSTKVPLLFYTWENTKVRCYRRQNSTYDTFEISEGHRHFTSKLTTGDKEKTKKKIASILTAVAFKTGRLPHPWVDNVDIYP